MKDSISETEYDILYWLRALGYENPAVVAKVVGMPFLKSPDATDALAIRGMHRLAREGVLSSVVGHAAFQDGITDAETTMVAAVGTLHRDPGEISRMLDPGYASIETMSSATERTPNLKISIVRTGSQSQPWTADAVRDGVEFVEQTMQLPLPTDHVIVLLNDKAVISSYAGTNYGFAVAYLPEYEQRQGTYEWRRLQAGLVHEIAHYYWRGNLDWIDEGLAETVKYMHGVESGLSQGQLQPLRKDCEAHDLDMLSVWDASRSSPQFQCNYYLGQMLFQELLESMDLTEFGAKLRDLYLLSFREQEARRTPGIAAVRQVFDGQSAIIAKHWSGALNAPGNRPFDEGLDRENHRLIQWNHLPTYSGRIVRFEGALLGDAVLSQPGKAGAGGYSNFTLVLADKRDYVGSILPGLSDGRQWTLEDPGDTVASSYALYPNTREFAVQFPWPLGLSGDPSDYVVTVWGFSDDRRVPSIGDNVDMLGYAKIRTG